MVVIINDDDNNDDGEGDDLIMMKEEEHGRRRVTTTAAVELVMAVIMWLSLSCNQVTSHESADITEARKLSLSPRQMQHSSNIIL